jgi:hypothetical protein
MFNIVDAQNVMRTGRVRSSAGQEYLVTACSTSEVDITTDQLARLSCDEDVPGQATGMRGARVN